MNYSTSINLCFHYTIVTLILTLLFGLAIFSSKRSFGVAILCGLVLGRILLFVPIPTWPLDLPFAGAYCRFIDYLSADIHLKTWLIVWAIGTTIGLCKMAVRSWRLRKLRVAAVPMSSSESAGLVQGLPKSKAGNQVCLCTTSEIPLAGAVGSVKRGCILLSKDVYRSLPQPVLRSIVAHEWVHLKRRDSLKNHLMDLICVVFWWNPAVWLFRLLWKVSIELRTDHEAVTIAGANPSEYKQSLGLFAPLNHSKLKRLLVQLRLKSLDMKKRGLRQSMSLVYLVIGLGIFVASFLYPVKGPPQVIFRTSGEKPVGDFYIDLKTTGMVGFSTPSITKLDGSSRHLQSLAGYDRDGTIGQVTVQEGDLVVYEMQSGVLVVMQVKTISPGASFDFEAIENHPRLNLSNYSGTDGLSNFADIQVIFYSPDDPAFADAKHLGGIAKIIDSGGGEPVKLSTAIRIEDLDGGRDSKRIEGVGLSGWHSFSKHEHSSYIAAATGDGEFIEFLGSAPQPKDSVQVHFNQQSSYTIRVVNKSFFGHFGEAGISINFSKPAKNLFLRTIDRVVDF